MKDILVPCEILTRYPLGLPTLMAVFWELYAVQVPPGQNKLTLDVETLLERLSKPYNSTSLRQLQDLLHDLYRLQKVGYHREFVDGTETMTLWLPPEMVKRMNTYNAKLEKFKGEGDAQ